MGSLPPSKRPAAPPSTLFGPLPCIFSPGKPRKLDFISFTPAKCERTLESPPRARQPRTARQGRERGEPASFSAPPRGGGWGSDVTVLRAPPRGSAGPVSQGLLTFGYLVLLSRIGERMAVDLRRALFCNLLR